ncbi:odorant receptor 4-like isoform X2 [Harpegnathos saltator]|uniref:odorant receptor 4-like isoform X2 n=1 Tax=Harpegnathos saltator TaxID=610380 RepID=UPI000948DCB8|nr:odorant receptor 4-like isoform X2 [Harpegnathos saltator]
MSTTSTISSPLKIGLGLIGMWPDSSYATVLWLLYMLSLAAMQYFQYSYVYSHLSMNDFSKLMDGLSVTLDYTLTFMKLLSLWHNRRIFSDILVAMDDDWHGDCVTDSYTCVMTSKAALAHRCSNAMMTLNTLSTVFYFIGSYLSHRTISADEPRGFPVQMQFPFNATKSPIFEFIVLGSFLHVWETAVVIAMLNSLILALVLHVSGQIDIMCQGLREISVTSKSVTSATRLLIERHQRIISLSNNIDKFFSFVAMIQFLWNTVVICTIGFMIVISLSTDMDGKSGILIQSIIPYIAVTLEAFVFCFAGEYLSIKSRSIGDAAYETLWYDLSTKECRILLLIIVRSQKRLTITAGNVMDLTLEGFTSVMKASASYISILHAMY